MPYYGIHIPSKNATNATATTTNSGNEQDTSEAPYVFDSKNEALLVLKLHKEARLREFSNEDDAIKYAETGYEEIVPSKFADPKPASTAATEKAAFRQPTKQELVAFRKYIESGDYERVKSIIWENPRYLVSSGDTPSTLKEGYRYNALHVCAISKKPRIAELILKTISDPKFVDLLTGKKNDLKMCKELCANLLDYYLNIPEKGRSETPLHFAAKIGSVEMVEVLTSYPECRMVVNNDGQFPKDIICSRQPNQPPEIYKKIETLLDERFYVPVLRSMDNAIPPIIGEPFPANNPPILNSDLLSPEVKIQALAGPMSKEQAKQFRRRWKTPPRVGSNTSSPIANNPFISPRANNTSITPSKTHNSFDPRSPTATLQRRALFNASPQFSSLDKEMAAQPKSDFNENAVETQNGNGQERPENEIDIIVTQASPAESVENSPKEANNNNNNKKNDETDFIKQSTLCPATPLLRTKKNVFFTYRVPQNINSPFVFGSPGLLEPSNALNDSMMGGDYCDSPGYKERHVKISDTEKGLEIIGRELAREQHVEWREYWDFLDAFIDIASADGLQRLENHLAQRAEDAEIKSPTKKKAIKTMATATVALDDVCNALEKFGFSRGDATPQTQLNTRNGIGSDTRFDSNTVYSNTPASSATTPYTCVEKSLQVFAKRMTKTIIHNIENVICINDTLISELKRLKSLIASFKEDTRFLEVNFSKVHSRIANLISTYLQSSQEMTIGTKAKILNVMKNLQNTKGDRREHIECVCSRIYDKLIEEEPNHVLPENLKSEDLCSKAWLSEQNCECQWESNLSRKTSRRNRMEARYKIHQQNVNQEKAEKEEKASDVVDWQSVSGSNDSSDEEVFWSDFGETESEGDEVWFTPKDSLSRVEPDTDTADTDSYKIYVYGNQPTKRDIDVLNAIFYTDIDCTKYPYIHAWKTALLRYPTEEMEYFPSPSIVKKSHKVKSHVQIQNSLHQTNMPYDVKSANTSLQNQQEESQSQSHQSQQKLQLPTAKRLFSTPTRSKTFGCSINDNSGPPKTPFNKLRGLFSSYREPIDKSPIPTMSPVVVNTLSSALSRDRRDSSDESKNLSLLNISAAE